MKILLPLLSFLIPLTTSALEVLGVVGPVTPAKPYYETLLSKQTADTSIQLSPQSITRAKRWAGDHRYDSGLTPGSFTPFTLTQEVTAKVIQPLCLIANDQRSKDWLAKSSSVLSEVKAVCYLVKLDDQSDLDSVRKAAEGIRVFALDPSLIINTFNVPFYPALISKRGVEQ